MGYLEKTNAESIIERLKEVSKASSDNDLSLILDVKRQNISTARKTDNVPPIWMIKVSEKFKVSIDYLYYGRETKPYIENHELGINFVSDRNFMNDEWSILSKTREVLLSKTVYSVALVHNINAFHDAVTKDRLDREISSKKDDEIQKLKNRLEVLETAIKKSSENGLRTDIIKKISGG